MLKVVAFLGLISGASADEIAFFYALEADLATLKETAHPAGQPVNVGTRSISRLSLNNHRIYAVKMGSGPVETAVSVEALLGRFRCDYAFSLGPVGSLGKRLQPGQWVSIQSVIAYQRGAWTNDGFIRSKSPAITVSVVDNLKIPDLWKGIESVNVASGEAFISSDFNRADIIGTVESDAVDMNLFGLLTACSNHRVPLTNWRTVSDRADQNASRDFQKFVLEYKGAGGRALAEVIADLPLDPTRPDAYPNLKQLLKPEAK